jgi:hypothetical protein
MSHRSHKLSQFPQVRHGRTIAGPLPDQARANLPRVHRRQQHEELESGASQDQRDALAGPVDPLFPEPCGDGLARRDRPGFLDPRHHAAAAFGGTHEAQRQGGLVPVGEIPGDLSPGLSCRDHCRHRHARSPRLQKTIACAAAASTTGECHRSPDWRRSSPVRSGRFPCPSRPSPARPEPRSRSAVHCGSRCRADTRARVRRISAYGRHDNRPAIPSNPTSSAAAASLGKSPSRASSTALTRPLILRAGMISGRVTGASGNIGRVMARSARSGNLRLRDTPRRVDEPINNRDAPLPASLSARFPVLFRRAVPARNAHTGRPVPARAARFPAIVAPAIA